MTWWSFWRWEVMPGWTHWNLWCRPLLRPPCTRSPGLCEGQAPWTRRSRRQPRRCRPPRSCLQLRWLKQRTSAILLWNFPVAKFDGFLSFDVNLLGFSENCEFRGKSLSLDCLLKKACCKTWWVRVNFKDVVSATNVFTPGGTLFPPRNHHTCAWK